MTREMLMLITGYVLVCGLIASAMKVHLLARSIRTRMVTDPTAANLPERIVADDRMLEYTGRILLTSAVAGLGAVFFFAVLNSPRPPNADGTYDLNQSTLLLIGFLLLMGTVEILQGVRAEVNGARLDHAMTEAFEPPEACRTTTYEGCPWITPERLLELRAIAHKLVDKVDDITEEQHGHD
jgi:hypothetical protein